MASSTDSFVRDNDRIQLMIPIITENEDQSTKFNEHIAELDKDLAKTYQEIWEVLYATRSDPDRGALYLIRHAYDQLFRCLAPDSEVRNSPYWKEKFGDKPNQIYRNERILYAINTHIEDASRK